MSNQVFPSIGALLRDNPYPGRGIIIGKSADGQNAVSAYFIMGRSANSQNRIFAEKEGVLYTEPFDSAKVEDPSLIIYPAQRKFQNKLILTNGDHTNTVLEGLKEGKSFQASLESRCFEPDAPHFTPRISGVLTFSEDDFSYEMSILKSADPAGQGCNRFTFSYAALPGVGHFLHTYAGDGFPLPSFQGEPEGLAIPSGIDDFTEQVWQALNEKNRISLYVRYTHLRTGREENRLINKNKGDGQHEGI